MLDEQELQQALTALRKARDLEVSRLRVIRAWLRGEVDDISRPESNSSEYAALVARSKFNLLPLVVTTAAQALFVDGYRATVPTESGVSLPDESDGLWGVWQANRMDSRQAQVYRPAITYGASYVTVLPGDPMPVLKPLSPWRCTALYEDPEDDEWPVLAMTSNTDDPFGRLDPAYVDVLEPRRVRVWDDTHVYTLTQARGSMQWQPTAAEEHGLGVCPVVRFRKVDFDGCGANGKIEPLIPLQQQINQTTFSLMVTQHFASFKQRWATGMAIEEDEDGNPISPWLSRIDAVWQNESPDGDFGEFSESPLDPLLNSRDKSILGMSSMAQVPPHNLLVGNGISNIAAETLAALESAREHDKREHQTSFGEAWEQVLRLAGRAIGDVAAAEDTAAQVVWRDTTPRSLGQLVDAFVKMAAGLGVPVEALWERIPGVTTQDIAHWKRLASEGDLFAELAGMMDQEAIGAEPASNSTDGPVSPAVGGGDGAGVPTTQGAAAFR